MLNSTEMKSCPKISNKLLDDSYFEGGDETDESDYEEEIIPEQEEIVMSDDVKGSSSDNSTTTSSTSGDDLSSLSDHEDVTNQVDDELLNASEIDVTTNEVSDNKTFGNISIEYSKLCSYLVDEDYGKLLPDTCKPITTNNTPLNTPLNSNIYSENISSTTVNTEAETDFQINEGVEEVKYVPPKECWSIFDEFFTEEEDTVNKNTENEQQLILKLKNSTKLEDQSDSLEPTTKKLKTILCDDKVTSEKIQTQIKIKNKKAIIERPLNPHKKLASPCFTTKESLAARKSSPSKTLASTSTIVTSPTKISSSKTSTITISTSTGKKAYNISNFKKTCENTKKISKIRKLLNSPETSSQNSITLELLRYDNGYGVLSFKIPKMIRFVLVITHFQDGRSIPQLYTMGSIATRRSVNSPHKTEKLLEDLECFSEYLNQEQYCGDKILTTAYLAEGILTIALTELNETMSIITCTCPQYTKYLSCTLNQTSAPSCMNIFPFIPR